jgi:regulator of replication initiation timing
LKIKDKIIGGVKDTLENIKDGKRLVELELENQMLRKENTKLKGMLHDITEHLTVFASQTDVYIKQIKKVDTKK